MSNSERRARVNGSERNTVSNGSLIWGASALIFLVIGTAGSMGGVRDLVHKQAKPRTSGKTGSQGNHAPTLERVPSDPGDPPGSYRFGAAHTTSKTGKNSPFPQKSGTDQASYLICPIKTLKILNASGNRINPKDTATHDRDKPITEQPVGPGGYSVVANGSFTDYKQNLDPVMRNAVLDYHGLPKTWNRGGVAVLDDGTIVVGRLSGFTQKETALVLPHRHPSNEKEIAENKDVTNAIQAAGKRVEVAIQRCFGTGGRVTEFMGGGALILAGGKEVSKEDLRTIQRFDQGNGGGGYSQQFHPAMRTLVGVKDKQGFLIVSLKSTHGADVQSQLKRMGFADVVMFDGGTGFFLRKSAESKIGAALNPLGLGVHSR